MANVKDTALSENTAPLGSDLLRIIDDPNGSPLTQRIYGGSYNLLPEGYLVNGKISVTVAANDITVALKTLSGGNPSATDPVSVWIAGAFRRCTAALSVTKADATDWMALGSVLPATETDLFAYLIWNTTPATDIMDIGFSRIPYGRVYSDFSGTTTNDRYLAFANASTPTSTDSVCVIGRFAATLSAGAGYTWSVPTYTNANLIQYPITETRWLTWTPTWAGWSVAPTSVFARYKIHGDECTHIARSAAGGTSNGTGATYTLPITARAMSNANWMAVISYEDNGAGVATTPGRVTIATGATTAAMQTNMATGAWTAANAKRIVGMTPLTFEI
jgi:hypothetical protein